MLRTSYIHRRGDVGVMDGLVWMDDIGDIVKEGLTTDKITCHTSLLRCTSLPL